MTQNIQRYGPNGDEVAALIERAQRLTADEVEKLAEAENVAENTPYDIWGLAWDAAWHAARKDKRRDAIRIFALQNVRYVMRNATWKERKASRAASNATAALVVKDLISKQHFDILYRPWGIIERG